eukprot:1128027-Alexandrium_andersonii.AAC.1
MVEQDCDDYDPDEEVRGRAISASPEPPPKMRRKAREARSNPTPSARCRRASQGTVPQTPPRRRKR